MLDVRFKMTAVTNVGLVRTNNEDNFIVNPDIASADWLIPKDSNAEITLGKYGCLMVVADGMGGMNAGEVASDLAVTGIRKTFDGVKDFSKIIDSEGHIESFMKRAIVSADSDIKQKVKEDSSTSGMGTTIVMAWLIGNIVHVAWCGDSRAYLFNKRFGLTRLSRDHSYVQELVDSGKLDPELAFDHPNSNIITRSLGDFPTAAKPDYMSRGVTTGDIILLCTDGLCGLVRDDEISNVLMQDGVLADYKVGLIDAALNAGGHDNVTIALLECSNVEEPELSQTVKPVEKGRKKKEKKEVEETILPEEKVDSTEKKEGTKPEPVRGTAKKKTILKKIIVAIVVLFVLMGMMIWGASSMGWVKVDRTAPFIHFNKIEQTTSYAIHGRLFA